MGGGGIIKSADLPKKYKRKWEEFNDEMDETIGRRAFWRQAWRLLS